MIYALDEPQGSSSVNIYTRVVHMKISEYLCFPRVHISFFLFAQAAENRYPPNSVQVETLDSNLIVTRLPIGSRNPPHQRNHYFQ